MIPKETIDRIIDTANNDLLNVIQRLSPGSKFEKRGLSYVTCCPLHGERTPSFHVSPSKKMWKCFGCGAGGGAVQFAMQNDNLSYIEAIRKVAEIVNIPVQQDAAKRPQIIKVDPVTSMQFEYRGLSVSDLELCGVTGAGEMDVYRYSMKLGLFALRSVTNPARKGEAFSWKIMEAPQYPILMFCYKNTDKTEWGTLFQPAAVKNRQLRNFGTRRTGASFFSEKIRDFAYRLRDGEIDEINLKGLLDN